MRHPLSRLGAIRVFALAHRVPVFVLTLVGIGLAARVLARVRLPAADADFGSYTHAVAFFIMPALLGAPLALSLDGDAAELERQAARSLALGRVLLLLVLVAVSVGALAPAAMSHPVPDACLVMVQGVLAVAGWTLCASRWLPPQLSWIVPLTATMIGILSPPGSSIGLITLVVRQYEPRLLVASALWLIMWAIVFATGFTGRLQRSEDRVP